MLSYNLGGGAQSFHCKPFFISPKIAAAFLILGVISVILGMLLLPQAMKNLSFTLEFFSFNYLMIKIVVAIF